ncbi:MAG: glycosyltransferase family 4 protein [Kiritimatiellia bacterium]|nr:glycosyltransferase family 4 protein [Kiritimatiellia bacterium]
MEKHKVIHVITRFDKGGSAENTFLTVRGLDPERYEVILIRGLARQSPAGISETRAIASNLEEARKAGVRILTIPELVRNIQPCDDLKALLKLINNYRKERPHIVHTHTSKAGILGRWAARLTGVPVIIHTPHGHVFRGYFNHWETALYVFLERLTAAITDKIITLTEQENKDYLGRHIAPASRFTTIHSGVALEKFFNSRVNPANMKKELGIPEDVFVVGTVGRFAPIKGHKYLIAAAQKALLAIPGMIFVFLGDGELLDELKAQAAGAGIQDNVMFLGWRPDVAGVMSTFDVFILPSLNEGMGKVLVEAMAMGKPIIASAVGGIADLVIHEENGMLVPGADAEAIAGSIERLYRDPARRKIMGEKGKVMAAGYSAESMTRKIDRLYGALLEGLPWPKHKT